MELADRFNIDESLLRFVVQLEPEEQDELVRQMIEFKLTRKQVQEVVEGQTDDDPPNDDGVSKEALRAIKLLRSTSKANPYDIARGLFEQEGDVHLARAYVQRLKGMLDEIESYLDEG